MISTDERTQSRVLEEKALTTEEICLFLNISRQTLYKLVRTKQLPGLKIGDKYRFFKSEILSHFNHDA